MILLCASSFSLIDSHSRIKVLVGVYLLLIVVALGGCYWMPVPRDDFSVLRNDPFSNLIREAHLEKGDSKSGRQVGVGMIDKEKAARLARELWLGKNSSDMTQLFNQESGNCLPLHTDAKEKFLNCEVSRQWKLKNIGAPFDTSDWSEPAAKLVFKMAISGSDEVIRLDLDVVDVTAYKPIKSK